VGGAKGTRTPDPHTASVVRYQLRHSPVFNSRSHSESLRVFQENYTIAQGSCCGGSDGWFAFGLVLDLNAGLPATPLVILGEILMCSGLRVRVEALVVGDGGRGNQTRLILAPEPSLRRGQRIVVCNQCWYCLHSDGAR
jgi:hypothetical protein